MCCAFRVWLRGAHMFLNSLFIGLAIFFAALFVALMVCSTTLFGTFETWLASLLPGGVTGAGAQDIKAFITKWATIVAVCFVVAAAALLAIGVFGWIAVCSMRKQVVCAYVVFVGVLLGIFGVGIVLWYSTESLRTSSIKSDLSASINKYFVDVYQSGSQFNFSLRF